MKPFGILTGGAVAMLGDNIDTDQICPKQYLTALERKGFDAALFSDYRFMADGTPIRDFILNRADGRDAVIIVGGHNFACGSSREHAVWALVDFGITCVIAPSFGDIFFQNSVNSGLLAITLPHALVRRLGEQAEMHAGAKWSVDLPQQSLTTPEGEVLTFDIDAARKRRLIMGLDQVAVTLEHRSALMEFEARQRNEQPWLWRDEVS